MDFKLSYLKGNKDLSSSVDMSEYVNSVINELKKVDDEILREISLKKLSEESRLDIDFLRDKLDSSVVHEEKVSIVKESTVTDRYDKAQMYLIYYMLNIFNKTNGLIEFSRLKKDNENTIISLLNRNKINQTLEQLELSICGDGNELDQK